MALDGILGKKFKLSKSELFEEYMKALGVGLVNRKLGNSVTPTIELTKDGDEYTLATLSTFKNSYLKFKPGVEFDEETLDGRKVKSTITVDGNKLIHKQSGEKATTIVREFTDKTLHATMTIGDVVCTREYAVQD